MDSVSGTSTAGQSTATVPASGYGGALRVLASLFFIWGFITWISWVVSQAFAGRDYGGGFTLRSIGSLLAWLGTAR